MDEYPWSYLHGLEDYLQHGRFMATSHHLTILCLRNHLFSFIYQVANYFLMRFILFMSKNSGSFLPFSRGYGIAIYLRPNGERGGWNCCFICTSWKILLFGENSQLFLLVCTRYNWIFGLLNFWRQ